MIYSAIVPLPYNVYGCLAYTRRTISSSLRVVAGENLSSPVDVLGVLGVVVTAGVACVEGVAWLVRDVVVVCDVGICALGTLGAAAALACASALALRIFSTYLLLNKVVVPSLFFRRKASSFVTFSTGAFLLSFSL